MLGNNKWNMHLKFIFSFEVGGFCVEHLTKITRGIEPQQKTKVGQEMDNFLLWNKHLFQCYTIPSIYKSCENNLKVLTYYKPPLTLDCTLICLRNSSLIGISMLK